MMLKYTLEQGIQKFLHDSIDPIFLFLQIIRTLWLKCALYACCMFLNRSCRRDSTEKKLETYSQARFCIMSKYESNPFAT